MDSRLDWYWNRLRCMSAGEVLYRAGMALRGQWRARFLARPRPAPGVTQATFGRRWFDGCVHDEGALRRSADAVAQGLLQVLALGRTPLGMPPAWRREPKSGIVAPLCYGPAMDVGDPRQVGDIKYLWEPSRHHDLVPLSQAWWQWREARHLDAAVQFVDSWIEQNPHPRGPHWSSSLECGIRLVNWSLAWHLLDAGNPQGELQRRHPGFVERWLAAVYWHLHFVRHNLSAHSSANNHLVGELAGLLIGSCTWRCWPMIDAWRVDAQRRLAREALRQNFSDGVNREQASGYQLFVLEFFILAGLCARAQSCDFEPAYWRRLEAMLRFVAALRDAGGNYPQIGDADDGVACGVVAGDASQAQSLLALAALLFQRGDLARAAGAADAKSAFWVGPQAVPRFDALRGSGAALPLPQWFPEGGYAVLGCEPGTRREMRLVFDAGCLGYLGIAAHGHADALSVLLSVAGEPLLVDAGTYSYHGPLAWREHFRSTRAHNTIEIDDHSQSLSGGRFMWLRHAQARLLRTEQSASLQLAIGEHRGYAARGRPLTHRRSVRFDADRRDIVITDELEGQGRHDLALRWLVAPGATVACASTGFTVAARASDLHIEPPPQLQCDVVAATEASPLGWVSGGYERKLPSSVIECRLTDAQLPLTLVTRMSSMLRAG